MRRQRWGTGKATLLRGVRFCRPGSGIGPAGAGRQTIEDRKPPSVGAGAAKPNDEGGGGKPARRTTRGIRTPPRTQLFVVIRLRAKRRLLNLHQELNVALG